MRKSYSAGLFMLLISAVLFSCAAPQPKPMSEAYLKIPKLDAEGYAQKVDNFLVILDASGSKYETYRGLTEIQISRDFLNRMNRTLPDLELTGGMRTFGKSIWPWSNKTQLIYGLTEYTEAGLQQAIDSVKWVGGQSPMAEAIDAGSEDLTSTQGRTALIIVGDGKYDNDPVPAAASIKRRYGDRLCIYTVMSGSEDPAGVNVMEQIADAGVCGFFESAKRLKSNEEVASWVERVFLMAAAPMDSDGDGVSDDLDRCPNTPKGVDVDFQGCPPDSDGDGVPDYLDQCPNTPSGVEVGKWGCPLDTDGDGVPDNLDKCPGTPEGAVVNEYGCSEFDNVMFDFNKSNIRPEYYRTLDDIVALMNANPDMRIKIEGHTDNIGTIDYNKALSDRRAMAAKNYLVGKGIAADRIMTEGIGLWRPAATNDTEEGRARNRRAVIKPIK
jgi:OOP family OmpA-OmpF porin